ncbi:MAG: hypothetical protein ACQETL_19985 [Bacteroidota bacterium]
MEFGDTLAKQSFKNQVLSALIRLISVIRVPFYMPFEKEKAFVSAEEVSTSDMPRVIAHELGHGTFRLYHTFSEKNDYAVPRSTTDNLMDYNNGKALHKYQWDLVQDPQGEWFTSLVDEEEMASIFNKACKLKTIMENIRYAAANNKNYEREYQIEGIKVSDITLSNGQDFPVLAVYSDNPQGVNLRPSKSNRTVKNMNRDDGEVYTYFGFGNQTGTHDNKPVYELEIKTKPEYSDELEDYLYDGEAWINDARIHLIDMMQVSRKTVVSYLDCMSDGYYKDLTVNHRMDILKTLNEGNNISDSWFGSPDEEGIAIRVIRNTPQEQISEFFSKLEENGLIIDLYKKIHDVMGADNQTEFMTELLMLYYDQPSSYLEICANQTGLYYPWVKNENHRYEYSLSFNSDNEISIDGEYKYLTNRGWEAESNCIEQKTISPMNCIALNFVSSVEFIGVKDKVVSMPTIFFKWLCDEVVERDIEQSAKLTAKILSSAYALGEVAATNKIYKSILSIVGLVKSSQDLIFELTDINEEKLKNSDYAGQFYEYWNITLTILDGANSIEKAINGNLPVFYLLNNSWELLNEEEINLKNLFGSDYEKINETMNKIDSKLE